MRLTRAVPVIAALAFIATPLSAQRVTFERAGYRLSSIGERQLAVAHVVDTRGNPVPNVPIIFRIADPSVATVSPRGEMVARRPGNTFVWAVAGKDSASAIVLVEQLAAKFSFSPPTLRIDALTTKVPLKIQASDAAGNPLPGGTTKASLCRSLNPQIATFSAAGEVTAVANGSTYVRCSDRGIADSLRIEVRQRAASVVIAANLHTASKQVGDTFTVAAKGRDRAAKDININDVRPTWASLDPSIVSVDPTTGKATARDAGPAKIIVQIGDVADTANITVTGTRAPTVASNTTQQQGGAKDSAAAAPTETPIARTALFKVTPVEVYLGESKEISITARDSNGAAMPLDRLRFDGVDTSLVRLITRDSLRVIGKKEGSITVYARLGNYVDTTSFTVSRRTLATNFVEPIRHPDSGAVNTRLRDSVDQEIKKDYTALRQQLSRLALTAEGYAFVADHSTGDSSATLGNVQESRSGKLIGGKGTLTLFRVIELSANVAKGDFLPPTTSASGGGGGKAIEPLSVTQGDANLLIFPVNWLGIGGGITRRTETTPLATQAWTIPRVSLVNRFTFVGNFASSYTVLSLLPGASLDLGTTTTAQPQTVNMSAESGIELTKAYFRFGLTYYFEHIAFASPSARVDQFSGLRIRLGLSSAHK